jgi:FkbM family methyltransferase
MRIRFGCEFAAVRHACTTLRYMTPTPLLRSRVETLLTREPTTPPWLRSFQCGDVFLDIGANVGLYSIYAALVAGARVYCFEPESQNYALLNKNIFLNGLHEQVTAYCLAASDEPGLSNLYLCTLAVGFGHHDFGASSWKTDLHRGSVVYRKDQRLKQGALGMTLDALVESGALPVPNHIKIDVDGFEWKVLAGAAHTLSRPEVKSVLVETDFSIAENVDTIRYMAEQGWQFSQHQIRLFENEMLAPGELEARIKLCSGQQNFIYFRDGKNYFSLFEEFAGVYSGQFPRPS